MITLHFHLQPQYKYELCHIKLLFKCFVAYCFIVINIYILLINFNRNSAQTASKLPPSHPTATGASSSRQDSLPTPPQKPQGLPQLLSLTRGSGRTKNATLSLNTERTYKKQADATFEALCWLFFVQWWKAE